MPIYNYHCVVCNETQEILKKIAALNDKEYCPYCHAIMSRLVVAPKVRLFRAGVYEHIAYEPIHIDSMKQLKSECKKHGVTSAYAEDIC